VSLLIGDWYMRNRFRLIWTDAVERQAERVSWAIAQPDLDLFDVFPDFILYAFALRCLHRAADAIDKAGNGELRSDLATFEVAVPRFKDVRDVLDHFDEYGRGRGKLQDANAPIWIDADPIIDGSTLYLSGLSLELHSSVKAARALSKAACVLVWRVGSIDDTALEGA
jgi:hypothetical protein